MDFELSGELLELRKTAREWVEKEWYPLEKGWPERIEDIPKDVQQRLLKRYQELGLAGISAPKEYGGRGLGLLGQCIVAEELGKPLLGCYGTPSIQACIEAPRSLFQASEYQQEKYLIPTVRGDKTFAFSFSEPHAGSDFAAYKTRAVRQGDYYIVNGYKRWTIDPALDDYQFLYVVTDPEKGRNGFSILLVDREQSGRKVVHRFQTIAGWHAVDIVYENCAIPAKNLLGKEGEGWGWGIEQLNRNRVAIAGRLVGISQRAFELARDYAKQRMAFGKLIGEWESIQNMLVDSLIEIQEVRLLAWWAASRHDHGSDLRIESPMVKAMSAELVGRVTDRAMQVFGGIGITTETPIEKMWRNARMYRIMESTPEVLRRSIGKDMLRGYPLPID